MSTAEVRPARAQETRRVLRKLAESGTYVAALDAKSFGLFVPRNRFARAVLKLDRATVKSFAAEGLLAPLEPLKDGRARYVISAEGEAFLRRAGAPCDPFGAQHRVQGSRYIDERAGAQSARHAVNLAETPLGWLATHCGRDGKPFVTAAQYEAGERLREDFTRAQLMQRLTVDWSLPLTGEAQPGIESGTLGDAALDARRRLEGALAAAGRDLASLLIDVCCHLKRLDEAERARNWPIRTGKIVLRIGLSRLVEHYGLNAEEGPRRLRGWRVPLSA